MHASWVLDDRGDIWPEASRNLGLALKTKRSGADLTCFLVEQMGFVVIREHGNWTEIMFDPDRASPVALISVFYWLADRPFLPTTCVKPGARGIAQVFHKQLALQNHIGSLVEARTPRPDYERQIVLSDLSPFRLHLKAVVELCRADIPAGIKLLLLQAHLNDSFSIVERGAAADYELIHASQAMKLRDPELCAIPRQSFRSTFDRAFGAWSADQLQSIGAASAPITDAFNVMVEFSGRQRERYSYDRLVVPMYASSGRDTLLIAATVR